MFAIKLFETKTCHKRKFWLIHADYRSSTAANTKYDKNTDPGRGPKQREIVRGHYNNSLMQYSSFLAPETGSPS